MESEKVDSAAVKVEVDWVVSGAANVGVRVVGLVEVEME